MKRIAMMCAVLVMTACGGADATPAESALLPRGDRHACAVYDCGFEVFACGDKALTPAMVTAQCATHHNPQDYCERATHGCMLVGFRF